MPGNSGTSDDADISKEIKSIPDKSGTIDVDISKDAFEFLMKKYELYMEGYNYRDKLVNDIFFRIIHVFQLFLLILVISRELVNFTSQRTYIYSLCHIIIGFAGLLTMGSLFLTLQSLSSSKDEMRIQCEKIEEFISQLSPFKAYENYFKTTVDRPECKKVKLPNLKYWDAIANRKRYILEENKYLKVLHFDKKDKTRIYVSLIIINIWILIIIISIYCHPNAPSNAESIIEKIIKMHYVD
jgi:hypothetical protein